MVVKSELPATLAAASVRVLETADPAAKVALSHAVAAAWRGGAIAEAGAATPPPRPARPARPVLAPPRAVARRGRGRSPAARVALLHAVAHIELNAIDLAWDIVARFTGDAMPRAFFDDWVAVADDEARHFALVADRLSAFGAAYGDLPAHDGLWEAAERTADDLLARLAIVPMVLEARGLDVTPDMIARMESYGDDATAAVLRIIHDDEVGHVAAGVRWFEHVCRQRGLDPAPTWRGLVAQRFKGALKPPFDAAARGRAGMHPAFYWDPL